MKMLFKERIIQKRCVGIKPSKMRENGFILSSAIVTGHHIALLYTRRPSVNSVIDSTQSWKYKTFSSNYQKDRNKYELLYVSNIQSLN